MIRNKIQGVHSALLVGLMVTASISCPGVAVALPPLSVSPQASAQAAHLSPSETADRIAGPILAQGTLSGDLGGQLKLQALLALYDATGERKYLNFVLSNVKDYGDSRNLDSVSKAFSNINVLLFKRTGDPRYVSSFADQVYDDKKNIIRAFDGAISFYRDEYAVMKQPDGDIHLTKEMAPIFVDHLGAYAIRMAMAGSLTGDKELYKEAVSQILIFRAALRDPKTGLWNHGRGWYGFSRNVTAVKWGRAHGWLLHTLVDTMTYLPPNSPEFRQVSAILQETASALKRYQDRDGFWHQVVDRPESFPETSGTGLISYYFARAVRQGYLPRAGFEKASKKAFEALAKHRISSSGAVYGASISTPPLSSVDRYMSRATPVDDPHGVGAAIYAAAGQLLLEGKGEIP